MFEEWVVDVEDLCYFVCLVCVLFYVVGKVFGCEVGCLYGW